LLPRGGHTHTRLGGVSEGGAVTARTAVLVGHARKGSAQQRADAVRIQSAPHVRKGTVIHAERAPVPAAFGRKREFRAVHRAAERGMAQFERSTGARNGDRALLAL